MQAFPLYLSQAASQQAAKDNPYWPNTSAEDRARDVAAKLPLPHVSGAVWRLTEHDLECLATGAGILGCGGGGDPNNGRLRAVKMLKEGKEIKVVNPCRVDASTMGLVCGVAFMGAPVILQEKLVGEEEVLLAITRVRQVLASGVSEGEEGRERTGGEGKVRITENTCRYSETSFPIYLANEEDLKRVPMDNIPLVILLLKELLSYLMFMPPVSADIWSDVL